MELIFFFIHSTTSLLAFGCSITISFASSTRRRCLLQLVLCASWCSRATTSLVLFLIFLIFYYGDRSSSCEEEGKSFLFFIIRKFMLRFECWKFVLDVFEWSLRGVRVRAVVESIHDWLRCYNCLVLIVYLFACIIACLT